MNPNNNQSVIKRRRFTLFNKIQNSAALHGKIQKTEKQFLCDTCGISFNQLINLKSHMLTHSGDRPYRCDTCDLRFRQLSHLIVHKRIHTNKLPYGCDQCPQKFRQLSGLQKHLQRHHIQQRKDKNIPTYQCVLCKESYLTYDEIKIHMRLHTGYKPFQCRYCDREFMFLPPFQKHINWHKNNVDKRKEIE